MSPASEEILSGEQYLRKAGRIKAAREVVPQGVEAVFHGTLNKFRFLQIINYFVNFNW